MPDNDNLLKVQLGQARQQLQFVQAQVVALETQLGEDSLPSFSDYPTNESHYDHAFGNMLEGCQIIDFNWRYIYLNEPAMRHAHRPKETLIGHTMMECYPGIEETEMFTMLRHCMETRTVGRMENAFIYPEGSIGWFELSIQPIDVGIFILSLDITKHKQTEERLKRYLQRMEILHEIDRKIIEASSIQTLLSSIVTRLRQLIPCQRVGVAMIDMIANESVMYAVDVSQPSAIGVGLRSTLAPDWRVGFDDDHIRVIDDLRLLPNPTAGYQQLMREGILSSLHILLTVGRDEPVGVLGLSASSTAFFTQEHREIAAEIGRQLSIAIHQLMMAEALSEWQSTLEHRVKTRTEELQAAKERVEAILNNSPDGIVLVDTKLRIQQVNMSFDHLFSPEQYYYLDKTLVTLIHPDDAPQVTQTLNAVLADGVRKSIEARIVRTDGVIFDVELNVGHIKDDGVVCVIRDMTERKAQERQLRYHASLQENVNDAVIVTDLGFHIQSWNRAAERIYGWQPEEVIGKTAIKLLKTDFLNAHNQKDVLRQLREKGWWQGEVRQHHRNGEIRYLLASVTIIHDEHEKPFGIISVNHDITDRKQSEESLQRSAAEIYDLYNHAPCGYHSLDAQGMFIQINDTELEWLGYTREEVVGKLNIRDLVTSESIHIFQANFPIFKERGYLNDLEFDMVCKDGRILHMLLNTKAAYDEHGQYLQSRSTLFDITDLREAQQSIIESEARYRLLAENMTDVVAKADLRGIRTFITPACYNLFGYTVEELLGRSPMEMIHPEDRIASHKVVLDAVASGKSTFTLTQRIRHKAGHYLWVEGTGSIVRDPVTGEPQEVIVSSRDITKRKRAEDALRESESKFRMLLDAAPIATIITSPSGEIALVNVQAEGLFGYSREELAGQPVGLLIPAQGGQLHNYNEELSIAALPIQLTDSAMELIACHRDGSKFPIEIKLSYIQTKDGLMVMSFIVDITERKRVAAELEQQRAFLRNVIDVSPSMIFVKDYDSRFVLANPVVAKMYRTTIENLIGKTDADFNPSPSEVDAFLEGDRRVIVTGATLFTEEPITTPEGEARWLQTTKVPIVGADGTSKYVLGVATDITERRNSEEAMRQALEKEKELGELKSRFVSMASHEFRTPLATIMALTETLVAYRHKLPDDQIESRLDKIQTQIGHLKDIMEDVLLLARMQARRVEFNPTKLNLDALCRSVIDEFQSRPEIIHNIDYICDQQLYEVTLDKKLMRQIINNLVSNAVKYSSPEQEIIIRLVYETTHMVLRIEDKGIGIPEADLKHLFEPFHRAENVGAISGTGLGMVITKEAVDLHNGSIEVESQVGMGTTFTVTIPIPAGETDNNENSSN